MDILGLRILDLLADDEEQLEELYLDSNFRRADNILYMYRQRFRLSEVLDRLRELESTGLVRSKALVTCADGCSATGRVYCLTDSGRGALEEELSHVPRLYELAEK
jgi:hypothetical protein